MAEEEIDRRRERGQRLLKLLENAGETKGVPGRICRPIDGGEAGFLRLPWLVDGPSAGVSPEITRLGVARGYPTPLSRLPQIQPLSVDPSADFPGAEELSEKLFTIPTHSRMAGAEIKRLVSAIK
jgi:dTDP-4-amino-4,6-dideoxygalactose transaminase